MPIEAQMKFHELQAMWWMHSATNGHAETRTILKGGSDGIKMTSEELRDDSMRTSQQHMRLFMECAEFKENKESTEAKKI